MGFAALIFFLVALILVGVGIVVGLIACGLAGILIGLGVISTSFLVGIRSGRPAAGIRAFFIQSGVLTGIPAGAFCAWFGHTLFIAESGVSAPISTVLYGAAGGATAGFLIALCLDAITRRLQSWAVKRLEASRGAALNPPRSSASGSPLRPRPPFRRPS